jgi:AraC family transcriptional regulator
MEHSRTALVETPSAPVGQHFAQPGGRRGCKALKALKLTACFPILWSSFLIKVWKWRSFAVYDSAMNSPEPIELLKAAWGVSSGSKDVISTNRITVCHWCLDSRELPSAVNPANIMFVANRLQIFHRIVGRRRDTIYSPYNSVGMAVEGEECGWRFDKPVDAFHIYISNQMLEQVARAEGKRDTQIELRECLRCEDPLIIQLAHELTRACKTNETNLLYADTLALCMAMRLLHTNDPRAKAASTRGGLSPLQLRRITDYLTEHMSVNVTLAELASIAELSPFHFARAFKQSTGQPPHRYQIFLRIEKARELLDATTLSVADVAAQLGYDDPSYFARLFVREFGMAPQAYRRKN